MTTEITLVSILYIIDQSSPKIDLTKLTTFCTSSGGDKASGERELLARAAPACASLLNFVLFCETAGQNKIRSDKSNEISDRHTQ